MIRITKKNRIRFSLISVLVLAPLVLYTTRDKPPVRWGIHRSLDYIYSSTDILSETHPIPFGPLQADADSISSGELSHLKISTDLNHPLKTEMGEDFGHEWLEHPSVKLFEKTLPFKVDSTSSIFELSQQVRSLTHHSGDPLPEVGTDPIAYLNFAIDHRGMTCRYFSVIYGATARLAGYTTRLISLSKSGTQRDHAVCEVYVPEFSKWILIDPDFNIAYQQRGVWLNAKELHQEWIKVRQFANGSKDAIDREQRITDIKNITGVEVVELGEASSELRRTNMYGGSSTGVNLELFEYVLFSNRNDYLSASYPPGHPARSREYLLNADPRNAIPPVCPEAISIDNVNELYWSVGRSQIEVVDSSAGVSPTVTLKLSTWTPNFAAFEVSQGGDEWVGINGDQIKMPIQIGTNIFKVRSVNQAGLRGDEARIKIQLQNNMAHGTQATKVQDDLKVKVSMDSHDDD